MMDRRKFVVSATVLAAGSGRAFGFARADAGTPLMTAKEVARIDHDRILKAAAAYLTARPVTITAAHSERSQGGVHDYFSEGDYWWPDPKKPGGPYIRRDGLSNPANFNDHREALIRLSLIVPALTAAYLLTKDVRYSKHAAEHLRAWFLTPATRMNPNLQYAQAIFGVSPGRGTGVIDTLHLIEVTRAMRHLEKTDVFSAVEIAGLHDWFAQYLDWMSTSKNGVEEELAKNNHGTCWVAQAAAFAVYTGNAASIALCRKRFKENLMPDQLAANGSFPLELARTKPYSYSLFDLDVVAILCELISTKDGGADDLWHFKVANGNTYKSAVEFMYPYLADKSTWPYPHDVEYYDDLPNRQPSLLFAGLAYGEAKYVALWRKLPPDPKTAEIIRNFPVRQPLLWVTVV